MESAVQEEFKCMCMFMVSNMSVSKICWILNCSDSVDFFLNLCPCIFIFLITIEMWNFDGYSLNLLLCQRKFPLCLQYNRILAF